MRHLIKQWISLKWMRHVSVTTRTHSYARILPAPWGPSSNLQSQNHTHTSFHFYSIHFLDPFICHLLHDPNLFVCYDDNWCVWILNFEDKKIVDIYKYFRPNTYIFWLKPITRPSLMISSKINYEIVNYNSRKQSAPIFIML